MTATAAPTEGTGRTWSPDGLTMDEACKRLASTRPRPLAGRGRTQAPEVGPNRLAAAAKEPGWHAFLRQYRDLMQLVLVGAAIASIAALQESAPGS